MSLDNNDLYKISRIMLTQLLEEKLITRQEFTRADLELQKIYKIHNARNIQ